MLQNYKLYKLNNVGELQASLAMTVLSVLQCAVALVCLGQNVTKLTKYSGETVEKLFRQARQDPLLSFALQARIASTDFYRRE